VALDARSTLLAVRRFDRLLARALFFERTVFVSRGRAHGAHAHPMLAALGGEHCELTRENMRAVALASGTVPLYTEPVRKLAGAPAGAYLDGSLTDYHVNQRVIGTGGIALCFLRQSQIVPGWLDKFVPWRHARAADLDDVLLVHPDREFIAPCRTRRFLHATISTAMWIGGGTLCMLARRRDARARAGRGIHGRRSERRHRRASAAAVAVRAATWMLVGG
jgi:hypothetical protein